jgi:NAD(P)H-dependent FMN reductase
MKLLAFGAALRKGSYNQKLAAAAAARALAKNPKLEVELVEFRQFEIPLYDGDLEDAAGNPAGSRKLAEKIAAVDALILSAPEYNGGVSGVLKNALDWISREDVNPFDGKPVLLLGASPGSFGGVRGLWHTRVPLEAMGALVFSEMFGLSRAHQAFDEKDELKDPAMRARLDETIAAFLKFATALACFPKLGCQEKWLGAETLSQK